MIAVRVYKNYDTHKLLGYSIVDEVTLSKTDIDNKVIKQMYKKGDKAISNLELAPNGYMRLRNMNPNVRQKWYARTMCRGITAEHLCIITAVKQGLISFIADKPDGSVICGNNVTISYIASALEVPVDQLKFYNGYISKDEIGKTEINVYDVHTGQYKKILEKRFDTEQGILGKDWEGRVADINTNGAYLVSLKNTQGVVKATIPEIVYGLERFKGGVNNLTIPISMKRLGDRCFAKLTDLYTVVIKEGVKKIPEYCFGESSLEKIELPLSVEIIDDYAFFKCTSLKGPLVSRAQYIGVRAFYGSKLSIVNIEGAEEIGLEAFARNSRLKTLKLYEGLRIIGHGAFRWCTSLEEVIIPSSVEVIGRKAFDSCPKLKSVKVKMGGSLNIGRDSFDPSIEVHYID